jgi:hypothetical protein
MGRPKENQVAVLFFFLHKTGTVSGIKDCLEQEAQ